MTPAFTSALAPRRQPFLYLAAAVTLGIVVDRWLQPPLWPVAVAGVAALAGLIYSAINSGINAPIDSRRTDRGAGSTTALVAVSIVLLGAGVSLREREGVGPSRLKRLYENRVITPDNPVELTGRLPAPPEPAPSAFFIDLEAEGLRAGTEEIAASGLARLYVSPVDELALDEFRRLKLDAGMRIRVLVRLERARSYSNPGSPDFNDFLERRGYDLKGRIKSPLLIEPLGPAGGGPRAALYRVRRALLGAIDTQFDDRVGGTLKAMLTGNRYFIDAGVSERLRENGTFHTLVIAGLHIGIIAWALLYLRWDFWRRQPGGRRAVWRPLAAMLVLWAYAIMVGLAPPVMRAATMISAGLIGPLIFRRASPVNTISLAVFAMLVIKPSLISDPGFQLSVAAVGAIAAIAIPLADRLRQIGEWRPTARTPHPPNCSRLLRTVSEMLFWNERRFRAETEGAPIRYGLEKSSMARALNRLRLQPVVTATVLLILTSGTIQLATLPLMAAYFNRVSPIGVLLNVSSGVLTAVLMLGGLAAIALASVSHAAAALCVAMVNAAHAILVGSNVPFAKLAFASFRVPHYSDWRAGLYALFYVPVAALAAVLDRWRPVDHFFPMKLAFEPGGQTTVAGDPKLGRRELKGPGPAKVLFSQGAAAVWCIAAIALVSVAVMRPIGTPSTGNLSVHFLDVGQGDSALVEFPRGTTMLVDAGGELQFGPRNPRLGAAGAKMSKSPTADAEGEEDDGGSFKDDGFAVGEAVVSRFLWSEGRRRLDYALATHADADHIGGFQEVLQNFEVDEALAGHVPTRNAEYDHFAALLERRRIRLGRLQAGDRFEIEGVRVEVLWPPPAEGFPVTSRNNDSLVLRLVYGSVAILLAGDIEEPSESVMLEWGVDLRADVLKVPHHGSKTSSTEAFLDAVRPEAAVISVGARSRFGHPHRIVVERYRARGVRLYQTGLDGMVTATTDGKRIDLESFVMKE